MIREFTCDWCGCPFERDHSKMKHKGKFCSRKCSSQGQGRNKPKYSPEEMAIRAEASKIKWRKTEWPATQRKRYNLIAGWIAEAKSKPCLDCGKNFPQCVMEFDHTRGVKSFDISAGHNYKKGLSSVIEEIAKCDILCANCHRIRTFERGQQFKGRKLHG